MSLQAKSDSRSAYDNLTLQGCDTTYLIPTDLGGATLVPGVYCFASSAGLTGTVPLTLSGTATTDVWVFKTVSTLITGPGSSVVMSTSGGDQGQACNVFWQIGSSATLDTTTQFIGNILAYVSISLNNGANVSGRLLAGMQPNGSGAVTMINNNITPAVCSAAVPPTLIKTFDPAIINVNENSALTITLSNPNSTAANLTTSFADILPIGVTFVGTNTALTNCGGTITNDATTVTLTVGSIPANGSCTVTADVTSSVVGPHVNTTTSLVTDKGTAPAASDTLTVLAPPPPAPIAPTLSKAFNPANINVGDPSTLTITLGNTNGTDANFALFTDTLPIGVTFVGSAINNGCGGTIANDANTVSLTLGFIPSGGCTVTATVTSLVPGLHLNTTGALVTDKGTAPPASDTLIANQILIGKSFSPATINAGGVSLLTITVTNPNLIIATPVAFTDFLPSSPGQMLVATGPQTNTCGGALTATTGSSSVTLAGGLLPANGSCAVTVYVTAATLGNYTNLLGTTSAILHVLSPSPTLSKAFSPATINKGGISTLTITLSNPTTSVATLTAALIDTLPSGVVIAAIPNASTTCAGSGAVVAIPNGTTVTLPATRSIPAGIGTTAGTCTVTVNVTAPLGGSYFNTIPANALQTSNGSNAAPAVATLTVENLKPQKSKFTFYYENVSLYNGKDSISSTGYLLGTGSAFQIPFNKDVTVEFSIDPLRFPSVSPRLLFKQTIKAGTVKPGSTRYRYLKSGAKGINELSLEKSGNNVYLYVWINYVNLLPDLKATLSQAEYLAFVRGIKSYNITVRIGDQIWSGNAPLQLWYFGEHRQQLVLNP